MPNRNVNGNILSIWNFPKILVKILGIWYTKNGDFMFTDMENLKIESVICAPSSLHRRYENRQSHALVLKRGGGTRYFFDNRTLILEEGQLLFLPKGACYTVQRVEPWESQYCLINFQADIPQAEPVLVSLGSRIDPEDVIGQLTALRILNTAADRYRLLSLFYTLAAAVAEAGTDPRQEDLLRQKLSPALEMMKENMFDPELRVSQLHGLCGMSDTCFRNLFVECFGMTPKKYILSRRLSHAKTLLDNGEYDSISQAAHLSGFDDPLYFSKAFKKRYGHPPTKNT